MLPPYVGGGGTRFVNEALYGPRKPPGGGGGGHYEREDEDSELVRLEFRQPRDTLLSVVAEFLTKCSARLADLSKKIPDLPSKATELLDVKCHLVGACLEGGDIPSCLLSFIKRR